MTEGNVIEYLERVSPDILVRLDLVRPIDHVDCIANCLGTTIPRGQIPLRLWLIFTAEAYATAISKGCAP